MKILSLFDGMSCGMLAMQEAGILVGRYVAYEYDEKTADAKKGRPYGFTALTSAHNFPMIEHRGDVFRGDFTEFRGFDFLVGGSPCTHWSIAQKNNRETEASGIGWELFCQYVRALREAKPKYFIYENNKSMHNNIRTAITEAFGFEPICINSALVSAQNRQRLYWVGKRNLDGTYSRVKVQQPEDRGILLIDVIDCGFRIPTYGNGEKARPLNALYSNNCGGFWLRLFSDNPRKQQVDMVAEPVRVGALPRPNGELSTSQGFRVYSIEGKAVGLKGQAGGVCAKTGLYAIPVEFDGDIPTKAIGINGNTHTVYEVKDGLITIKGEQYPIKLIDGYYIIRKLTVGECKRLQTVPEWYEFPVSDTQAYKMLGNGWTVDVIAHLIKATQTDELEEEQLDLFRMVGI